MSANQNSYSLSKMEARLLLWFVLLPLLSHTESVLTPTTTKDSSRNATDQVLSRRKRYITFPEGSTFSFAFCMELKTITQDIDIFSEGVAVAANYDLPSKPDQLFTVKPRPPIPVLQRRHRRDLYSRVEKVFNLAGLDGRSCVMRALCEAAQQFVPRVGMLEEIFRTIFLVPEDGITPEEPKEHWQYRTAYRSGIQNLNSQLASFLVDFRRCTSSKSDKDIPVCIHELQSLLKKGNSVLIDVRSEGETWRTGVIPGSLCVPNHQLETALKMTPEQFLKKYCREKPSTDDNIIFICKRGNRSFKAAKKAKELGYENVNSVQEGFISWLDRQRQIRELQSQAKELDRDSD